MSKLLTVLLLLATLSVRAQKNEADIKASLIYYFTQYVIWPEEDNLTEYKVDVLSLKEDIYESLKQIASTKLVKNKKIVVKKISSLKELENIQVLYVSKDLNNQIPEIVKEISQKHILLITDNYPNRLLFMINFVNKENDQKIIFEANKQNLKNEGFNYKNELLIYGGSQVDVKELLNEADLKLQGLMQEIAIFENNLKEKEAELKFSNQTIEVQTRKIEEFEKLLKDRETEYKILTTEIEEKQEVLSSKNSELEFQRNQQKQIVAEINLKKKELELAQQMLVRLEKDLLTKQNKLQKQNEVLLNQANKINLQKRQIVFSILLLVTVAFSLIAIFRSYRLKKKLSEELEQKVTERTRELEDHKNNLELKVAERTNEIVQLNEELQVTNEELYASNEMLRDNQSDLEKALKRVKDTQDQLIQSEKMASLGMLTVGIAHEINNPINFISSGQQLIPVLLTELKRKIENNDPNYTDILNQFEIIEQSIKTGVERTTEIIHSLRNYARFDSDEFVKKDLVSIIKEALLILRNSYKNRIEVIEDYADTPDVRCIPGKLYQVFVNLLSNAIDAIHKHGTITISIISNTNPGKVQVVIKDSGSGIDPKNLGSIFNPFFTTKDVGKGTGLGLYIVYGIIQQHNGKIRVESEIGKGTAFIIELPQ